jgi:superfamily II DNA helicase RecQ
LNCPFYKAKADDKGEILQEWIKGARGWIVVTSVLKTGINIKGIVYVVHVNQLYGLTSFIQQSGRGGWSGEVSDSIIIAQVQNSSR